MATRVLPGCKLSEERVEREAGGASSHCAESESLLAQASLPSPQGQLSTGRLASASGILPLGVVPATVLKRRGCTADSDEESGPVQNGTLGVRLGIDAAGALQLGNRSRREARGCCFTEPALALESRRGSRALQSCDQLRADVAPPQNAGWTSPLGLKGLGRKLK